MFRARMSETLQVQQHKRAQHIQVHNNFYIFRSVFAIARAPHLFLFNVHAHSHAPSLSCMLPLSICRVSPLCSWLYELRLSTKCVLYRYFTEYNFFFVRLLLPPPPPPPLLLLVFRLLLFISSAHLYLEMRRKKKANTNRTGIHSDFYTHRASVVVNSRSLRCRHHHIEAN